MNQTTPLLPTLLQQLKPLTKTISRRAEERWFVMFQSCPAAQNIDSTTMSHLMHGRRTLSSKYIAHYADLHCPHIPPLLYADLFAALEMMHIDASKRKEMMESIKAFILTHIDPVDHIGLLPEAIPSAPVNKDVIILWTNTMWFCICHDVANC